MSFTQRLIVSIRGDLFDVRLLFEKQSLTGGVFRVFMLHVVCSCRLIHELLSELYCLTLAILRSLSPCDWLSNFNEYKRLRMEHFLFVEFCQLVVHLNFRFQKTILRCQYELQLVLGVNLVALRFGYTFYR